MATRGWSDLTAEQVQRLGSGQVALKPSKFKNVKFVVDGYTFDSKREGRHYLDLKAREAAGEIEDLKCQVAFPLLCPTPDEGMTAMVALYVADFTYLEVATKKRVVVDVKGHRTKEYALKCKWLALQDGISIVEV